MQRLFNLDKWLPLSEGHALSFNNPRPRTVRLEVNAPVKSCIYYSDGDGEVRFLALVEGRDTVEFNSTGPFELTVEGQDLWVFTVDGDDISQKAVAPRIFTKIVERRRRNPELEQIAALMNRNMERRLEQQADEFRQLFARREAAARNLSTPPGVPDGAGSKPAATDGAGSSDPQVAPAPAGANAGDASGKPADAGGAKRAASAPGAAAPG